MSERDERCRAPGLPPVVGVRAASGEHRDRLGRTLRRLGFRVDGDEGADGSDSMPPSVVIIGDGSPTEVGERVSEVVAAADAPPVVVVTDHADTETLHAAITAGAAGLLPTDTDDSALARALLGVLDGELAVPRRLLPPVIARFRDDRKRQMRRDLTRDAGLTEREHEVLDLLVSDHTTTEIATALFVSPVTVRTHIAGIKRKLGVPTRRDAVRRVGRA